MNSRFLIILPFVLVMFKAVSIYGARNFETETENLVQIRNRLQDDTQNDGNSDAIEIIENLRINNDIAIKNAASICQTDLVKSLFDPNCTTEDVVAHIFNSAARSINLELLEFILGTGLCPENLKEISISVAVRFGKFGIVKLIFESGINDIGLMAYLFVLAKIKNYTDIIEYFEDKGVSDFITHDDFLIWTSRLGHIGVIEFIIKRGANVHVNDDEALRLACSVGNFELAKLLLDLGADPYARNSEFIRSAADDGHTEIVDLLRRYGESSQK